MNETPFDPGLQPERTSLAWQRTAISLTVGSLVYARVQASYLGVWAWGFALVGVVLGVLVGHRARARYRSTHRTLTAGQLKLPDGLLPLAVAAVVFFAGVAAAAVTLARVLSR